MYPQQRILLHAAQEVLDGIPHHLSKRLLPDAILALLLGITRTISAMILMSSTHLEHCEHLHKRFMMVLKP